jgi:hypothetical protein
MSRKSKKGRPMGLDIMTGVLSIFERADPEAAQAFREAFISVNEVLADAGQPPHHEPAGLPPDKTFEAQSWGYGGLHHLRRVAAYLSLEGTLPPSDLVEEATDDPVLKRLYDLHTRFLNGRPNGLRRIFSKGPEKPPFEHLLVHSDAEGFYLPRELEAVVFDRAQPQRESIGGMIGSSIALHAECRTVARALALPESLDPESEEIWDNAENPPEAGAEWQRFGITTFVLTRLLRACELSRSIGAAVVFT